MKTEWDLENGRLKFEFIYPYVKIKITNSNPHTINSSSMIIDAALQLHLNGTEIIWSHQTSTKNIYHYLFLEIPLSKNDNKDYSLMEISVILSAIDAQIQKEISKLINP